MTVLGNPLVWCFPCCRNLKGKGLRYEVADDLKPKTEVKTDKGQTPEEDDVRLTAEK